MPFALLQNPRPHLPRFTLGVRRTPLPPDDPLRVHNSGGFWGNLTTWKEVVL
jgi:hypothetical protein